MDSKAFWVGFSLVKGIGAVRFRMLLDFFGSLEVAWNAPASALYSAGLTPKVVESLAKIRDDVDLEKVMERIEKSGIHVITWDEDEYPQRLKEINQPPPVLYYRGSLTAADNLAVAIVGTRKLTAYGRRVTEELAAILAKSGVTVVSGLARGIDEIAHHTTVRMEGRTLAVLGSGVDRIYPPEHRELANQIMQHGALVSDYAPGTPPEGVNFPPRNRIISGLSIATIVVEAGEKSGALITATFAVEQGREVFAVPGSIYAPQSIGTNQLIQQGARVLTSLDDVLEYLQVNRLQQHQQARLELPVDATEARILQIIVDEPLPIDEIRVQSGLPIDIVSSTLAMMELKGMVNQVSYMTYMTVREKVEQYLIDDK